MQIQLSGYKNPKSLSILKIIVLIGGGVYIIPFLFSFSTLDPGLSIRFLALTALTIVLVLIILIESLIRRPPSEFTVIYRAIFPIIIGYAMVSGLSLIQTINLAEGISEWLKLFLLFAFLYVACLILVQNKAGILFLIKSVIVTALIFGSMGICQYFTIAFNAIPGNYGIYATMAHTNLFASALFLMLPFILFGALQLSGGWHSLSLVSLTGVIYAIAISETRAVWGATLIFISANALLSLFCFQKAKLRQIKKHFHARRVLLIIAIFFITPSAAIWTHSLDNNHQCLFLNNPTPAQLENSNLPRRLMISLTSSKVRSLLWQASSRMIKAEPILGVGLGQWKIILPAYEKSSKRKRPDNSRRIVRVQRPHNDFLWVFAETGVLGFLGYILFWGTLIYYGLRVSYIVNDIQEKLFAILMLNGIIGFAVISFFSFPKERIFHNIFFMFIAACLVSIYHKTFPISKTVSPAKIFYLNISILVLLIFCLYGGYSRFEAEMHAKKAWNAHRNENWQRVILEIDKADRYCYHLDPTSTPLVWYRGMANFSLGKTEKALRDFRKAYAHNPYHIHVINDLGECYAMLQDFEKAIDYYQKALAISPRFEKAMMNLSGVYYQMGKFRKARDILLRCIHDNPQGRTSEFLKKIENQLQVFN